MEKKTNNEIVASAIAEIEEKEKNSSTLGFDSSQRRSFSSYQQSYGSKEKAKRAKTRLILVSIAVFVLAFALFGSTSYELFKLILEVGNNSDIAKWVAIGSSVLVFLLFATLYIIFISNIYSKPSFDNYYYEADLSKRKKSKLKNRETRVKVAKHIVDVYEKSDLLISSDPLENAVTDKILDLVIKDKEVYDLKKFPLVRTYNQEIRSGIKEKYVVPFQKAEGLILAHPKTLENNVYNAIDLYNLKMAITIKEKFVDVDGTGSSDYLSYALANALRKDGVIYRKAKSMIIKQSVTTGLLTAASPSGTLDAAIIALQNMKMISDLASLYGFRLSDAQMSKLMTKVMINTVTALGLGSLPLGNLIASKIIPDRGVITGLVRGVIDFAAQTITNGYLTLYCGYHTIRYLMDEFALQAALDINDKALNSQYMPLEITDKVKTVIGDFITGKIEEAKIKNENASFSEEELTVIEKEIDSTKEINNLKSFEIDTHIERSKKEIKECEEEIKTLKKRIEDLSKRKKEALKEEKETKPRK